MEIGLAVPLHVVHQVGVADRIGHRRSEHQLIAQSARERVALDHLQVDDRPGQLLVARIERGEVTERDERVAHAPHGQVDQRIADVAELEVEHRRQMSPIVVELAGVADDGRLTAVGTGRVPSHPAEAELRERIGRGLLGAPVLDHPRAVDERGVLAGSRANDACLGERLDRELMDLDELLQVLIDDHVAVCLRDAAEVGSARDELEDQRVDLRQISVQLGHLDAVVVKDAVEGHLVLERVRLSVGPIAANDHIVTHAVLLGLDEPGGAPSGLPSDVQDVHAHLAGDYCSDVVY
nr:hypothetical protein [Aeromicrobium sp. S22]